MFNTILKPNMIIRIGTLVAVVEGEDIYRKGVFNIYSGNNTKRTTCASEVSDIISIDYVGTNLFAYQVYNMIK